MADLPPGAAPAGSAPPIAVDRVSLAAVLAAATAVGVFPYALFLGSGGTAARTGDVWPAVALVAGLVAGGVALASLRRFTTLATERPHAGEKMLGGWTEVAAGGAVSLLGMIAYGLVNGVLRAVRWIGGLDLDVARWSLWISLGAVALLVVGSVPGTAEDLARKLYPDTAGARSRFHALLLERRLLGKAVLVGLSAIAISALVFALVAWFWPAPWRIVAVLLAIFLVYTAGAVDALHRPREEPARRQRSLRGLAKLLGAAGYETRSAPRTGRSEVDPLIANVDLLATSPERALVIEVKDRDGHPQPVEWHEASRLRTAAWALEEVLHEEQGSLEVVPVLVLIGRERHESLDRYLRDEPLTVVEIGDADLLAEALRVDDPARLRTLAVERLGVRLAAGGP